MGQALYRKYRSKSFKDVVGQEHITKTLENAIKSGRISHAYLFTGPRGVGKTSVARILAHEVNQLPYDEGVAHLDIIEIDAASNRRIDEIRDLRDKVRIAPASSKYKVYIIDEVHMLTKEAFNALLKTLEEPPAHCIFILATTEAYKLPETIISRTQRFEFKPIAKHNNAEHLAGIAKKEKINISREALDILAEFGQGSFRDSISYLDQLSSHKKDITEQDVTDLLGIPSATEVDELLKHCLNGEISKVLESLERLASQGISAPAIAKAVAGRIRSTFIQKMPERDIIILLKELLEVPASSRPADNLEVILLEFALNKDGVKPKSISATVNATVAEDMMVTTTMLPKKDAEQLIELTAEVWDSVIALAKKEAASIYTALRLARPEYDNGVLSLYFQFPLHQKKLEQSKNKELVAKIIEEITGTLVHIKCILEKKSDSKKADSQTQDTASIGAITNIFGTAEVLES